MRAASQGEPEGAVFVAEEQTAGRGRGGHRWESNPSEGIYCSAVLRPHLTPADVLLISLATGLAVWEAVHEITGVETDLRWPNDVLCGNRKVCGILIEMHAEATRVQHLVAGMGLNVNQHEFPPELRPIATSLRLESGRDWSRVELAAALLKSFDREYRAFVADLDVARREVLRRFELHSSYVRGRAVEVDEDGGYQGITAGMDARGFLQVRTEAGMKTVLSGGVRPK
jgi:BirA family biotin operon repressor/biotin-[acetyl-CoA-carboxylase] ligase